MSTLLHGPGAIVHGPGAIEKDRPVGSSLEI